MIRLLFVCVIFILGCSSGYEEAFYQTGQLEYRVPLENELRHGLLKKYFPTGELQYVSNWINGVKSGKAMLYYPNGILHVEENYKEGMPYGLIRNYDSLGRLKHDMYYDSAVLQGEFFYFLDGSIETDIKINGDSIYARRYYQDGNLKEVIWRIGDRLKLVKKYDPNGNFIAGRLPISIQRKNVEFDLIEFEIQIDFTDCDDCYFLLNLGKLSNDKSQLLEFHKAKYFDGKAVEISIERGELVDGFIEGKIYEMSTDSTVVGVMPFKEPI